MENFISNRVLRLLVAFTLACSISMGLAVQTGTGEMNMLAPATKANPEVIKGGFPNDHEVTHHSDSALKDCTEYMKDSIVIDGKKFPFYDLSYTHYNSIYDRTATNFIVFFLGSLMDDQFKNALAFENKIRKELYDCYFGKVYVRSKQNKNSETGTFIFNLGYIINITTYTDETRNTTYEIEYASYLGFREGKVRWERKILNASETENVIQFKEKWERNKESLLAYYKDLGSKYEDLIRLIENQRKN